MEGGDAAPDDTQIAFECLETARMLYEKHPTAAGDLRLAEVFLRIGDLYNFNNNEPAAIGEYLKVKMHISILFYFYYFLL